MDKIIITAAVTGSQPSREMNPNLPVTPEEIAASAIECMNAGAAIVHVHVRDPETGIRSTDFALYEEVVERVRAESNMIINLTTGPGGQVFLDAELNKDPERTILMTADQRVEHIQKLKPEMCSLDIGSTNFGPMVFLNPQAAVDRMALKMQEAGVKPEVEIFDFGQIRIAKRLMKEGLLEKNAHFQLCMGTNGGIPATARSASALADELPDGVSWSIFGVGATQFPMVAMGAVMGGHVRVGMEDNLYLSKGVLCDSNAQLVERAASIIRSVGREVASVDEARTMLGL
ncbi:3-keto-5-aminohexanoate cleavage protein [uncultured Sulfitobacter sp.]|uniref:3-keto-5-aminohexanoate cleavage protein n=1 Tax=uncultured Sulfitobacter sp. TaxID=191468 RepID=UPI002601D879|nr:3-keto-5-aminohexanoate cleavage protein [uncultured Sulfitobacter sp.]